MTKWRVDMKGNTGDTHQLSIPSPAEGWVCAAWQSRIWPNVPGTLAETLMPWDRTLSPPHWPPPPYSTLGQHCPQTHTCLFLERRGQTCERNRHLWRRHTLSQSVIWIINNLRFYLQHTDSTLPCGVKVCLFHEHLQMSEGTKVPAGVTIKQVVFLIHWEVTQMAVWGG